MVMCPSVSVAHWYFYLLVHLPIGTFTYWYFYLLVPLPLVLLPLVLLPLVLLPTICVVCILLQAWHTGHECIHVFPLICARSFCSF